MRIADGSNRVIGTYCGQQTGRSVLVNDTDAVLTFKTDGSVHFSGFHLSFAFFPRGKIAACFGNRCSCSRERNVQLSMKAVMCPFVSALRL